MNKLFIIATIGTAIIAGVSCSKTTSTDTASTTLTASDVSGILNKVDEGIENVGSGLGGAAALTLASKPGKVGKMAVSDVCDDNAQVRNTAATSSDPEYPALVHYCLIAKDTGSPDSVQGAYALLKNISCGLKSQGAMTFDGEARSVTITMTTACFTQSQIDDIGGTISATVTGSSPASFNTNYEYGIHINAPAFGKNFYMATKKAGDVIHFMSREADATGEDGSFAGTYDQSTGEVFYEARMDRYDATCGTGSCGWSRHIRLYADTTGSGDLAEIENYQGIYTNVNKDTTNGTGDVATAKGNLTDGLFSRYWTASTTTRANLADPTNGAWVENGSGACIGDGTPACTGNSGINFKSAASNGNFLLIPTDTTYSNGQTWSGALNGLSFTTLTFSDTN